MNTVDKAKEYAEGKVTEALTKVVADAYMEVTTLVIKMVSIR